MSDPPAEIVKGLINVQILRSGHAEHHPHTLSFQTLQQQISAGQSRRLSILPRGVTRFRLGLDSWCPAYPNLFSGKDSILSDTTFVAML